MKKLAIISCIFLLGMTGKVDREYTKVNIKIKEVEVKIIEVENKYQAKILKIDSLGFIQEHKIIQSNSNQQ